MGLAGRYVRVELQCSCSQGLAIREHCREKGCSAGGWLAMSLHAGRHALATLLDVAWSSDEGVNDVGWAFRPGKIGSSQPSDRDLLTITYHAHTNAVCKMQFHT